MAAEYLEEQYEGLQEGNDRYEQLISQEKEKLLRLDQEISEMESQIRAARAVPGGMAKHKEKHKRHMKQIRHLENKLEQETRTLNEIHRSNKRLLEEIGHLQQQRDALRSKEEKLNARLAAQRRTMEELGKKTIHAHSQRSETQAQMATLEARYGSEVETKRKMLAEMKKATAQDGKMHTFMEKKLKKIIPLKDDDNSKTRKKQELETSMQGPAALLEASGEQEPRPSGRSSTNDEHMIPALVNYVNELHSRRSELENRTAAMKKAILLLEQENDREDEQSKAQITELESELQKQSCLLDSLEKQSAAFRETLDQIKMAVAGLVVEATQAAAVVTDDNIVHFIGVLEESFGELLIQANDLGDEDTDLPPQNLLLANFNLLPESVEDTPRSVKSPGLS